MTMIRYAASCLATGLLLASSSALAGTTQTGSRTNTNTTATTHPTLRRVTSPSGGGPAQANAGPVCPSGCIASAVSCPPGCTLSARPLTAAQRRAARERAEEARRQREAQAAALDDAQQTAHRAAQELANERTERTQADAQRDAEVARMNAHLQDLQAAHDDLYQTAMRNRFVHENRVVARGGGPVNVDSAGFYRRPRIELGLEGGGIGYVAGPINDVYHSGGMWGARFGVAFANWLALEARYIGGYTPNRGISNSGLLLSGGSLDARLTAPLPYIHPYGFAGVGLYNQWVTTTPADNLSAIINGRTAISFPLGGGIDIPITHNFSVGAEGAYHVMVQTSTVDPTPVNNLWTASGLMRFTM